MSSNTNYVVSLSEDEVNIILKSLDWTIVTLFEKKGNDFPISLREAKGVGYKLESMMIDYWSENAVR